jgi:transposase InsO family protein
LPGSTSLLHRRQDTAPAYSRQSPKPGAQTTGASLRVRAAWGPDPHRHQEPGPVPQGGPPHHWKPAAGAFLWRRLRHVHVAVDDTTRLAYVEVLADEKKATVIGFLSQAIAWLNSQGIECFRVVSDNGPAYDSKAFAKACRTLGLRRIRTRLYTPRTNGIAGRFTFHSDPVQGVGLRHGLPELQGAQPVDDAAYGIL